MDTLRLSRRSLLALGLAGFSGRLLAAAPDSPRLLLVFLRGAYDCASALVPYSSSFYYESRRRIAIPAPVANAADGSLALDANWALAPALRSSLGPLYQQRQLAFIPFAGTDDTSRSHFETQDSIEMGQAGNGSRDFHSGFLGRLAQVLAGTRNGMEAIAFTDALPLCMQLPQSPAGLHLANMSLRDTGRRPFDERQTRLLDQMYAGQPLQESVATGLAMRREVAATVAEEMNKSGRNAINANGFAGQAERIAMLMRDHWRLGFIDIGGWDTHVNQGGSTGALATRLQQLGTGLAAYANTLGAEWRNTVVVVISEFGRTFRENGDGGTDHGHGTVYWVLGGGIRGGQIAGRQQAVTRQTLFQDRDYPVLNDYREVLGGLFRSIWGLSSVDAATVFPGAGIADLKLL